MQRQLSTRECAEMLKAMADETRLAIIRSLFRQPKCGTELADEFELTQPHVAHHLGVLRKVGLISPERRGQRVDYSLHPTVRETLAESDNNVLDLGCCQISFADDV